MQLSFLIQKSPDRRSFTSFPELIAGYHVFRRLSMPRHPPYTLSSLTKFIDHRHQKPKDLDPWVLFAGRARRNKRSITCYIAKKVLDDTHPTKRQPWGSRLCRGEHRGGSSIRHTI